MTQRQRICYPQIIAEKKNYYYLFVHLFLCVTRRNGDTSKVPCTTFTLATTFLTTMGLGANISSLSIVRHASEVRLAYVIAQDPNWQQFQRYHSLIQCFCHLYEVIIQYVFSCAYHICETMTELFANQSTSL